MGIGCYWNQQFLEAVTAIKTSNSQGFIFKDLLVSRNGPCKPESLVVNTLDPCHSLMTFSHLRL